MGFRHVGKTRHTKSGNGLLLEIVLGDGFKHYLTVPKSQVKALLEDKIYEVNVSLIVGGEKKPYPRDQVFRP